jgi:hypothetical protein
MIMMDGAMQEKERKKGSATKMGSDAENERTTSMETRNGGF